MLPTGSTAKIAIHDKDGRSLKRCLIKRVCTVEFLTVVCKDLGSKRFALKERSQQRVVAALLHPRFGA